MDNGLDKCPDPVEASSEMIPSSYIHVSIARQEVELTLPGRQALRFPVSTAANGPGFAMDSGRTPTGRFVISEKIGAGAPWGTIFKARVAVGVWQPGDSTEGDLILSRILRIAGLDPENSNTMDRYIYFHGTNQEERIGQPASYGCIRMKNDDIIQFFDLVSEGDPVLITID